ncbi:hypothetical protein V6N13_042034 [Hibiscus sabdariffa]
MYDSDDTGGGENWWPVDDELYMERKKKSKRNKSKGSVGSVDWLWEGLSGELRRARDSFSGEIPKSGGASSTPSMRGTVCYVAPEYGGGGDVSEKCDVYSYGVVLLVLIAGRRPLQVTGSPMSEFQRANLISWARRLARTGKLIDLVDQNIQSLNREQALLCITVALLCLQKLPARRPSMKEVVGMLTGETEPPQLPTEFSPSPPSRYPFKSRKKVRQSINAIARTLVFSYVKQEKKDCVVDYGYEFPGVNSMPDGSTCTSPEKRFMINSWSWVSFLLTPELSFKEGILMKGNHMVEECSRATHTVERAPPRLALRGRGLNVLPVRYTLPPADIGTVIEEDM